jgi:protoheme IX farnesyltransferase
VAEASEVSWSGRLAAYVELTKPRIAMLVLVVVATSAWIATHGQFPAMTLLHTLFGTLLVAGSACAANQWLELARDRLMPRTAGRPLVRERITPVEAALFTAVTLGAGLAWLAVFVNPATAGVNLLTWAMYVCVYTPLKTVTVWNTLIGAVPGALPVVIGWTSVDAAWDGRLAALFALVFLWQFPHFMAIAWLYRQQYARAGFVMLPTYDESGFWTGFQAVLCAAFLLPVSVLPAVLEPGSGSVACAATSTMLGLIQLAVAVVFAQRASDIAARRLLWMSLCYLPLVLLSLLLFPLL